VYSPVDVLYDECVSNFLEVNIIVGVVLFIVVEDDVYVAATTLVSVSLDIWTEDDHPRMGTEKSRL